MKKTSETYEVKMDRGFKKQKREGRILYVPTVPSAKR